MQTTRVSLETEIIRRARDFADCFDGLDAELSPEAYIAWHNLSTRLTEYDRLEPGKLDAPSHTANADGPDTQHEAAVLAQFTKGGTAKLICDQLIIAFGASCRGLTCQELESKRRLDLPHETTSSAVNWLLRNRWIRDSGFKRTNRSGRWAIVWELTPAAWEKLRPS